MPIGRFTVLGLKPIQVAHWMDYGNKTVSVSCRERKQVVLEELMKWAGDRYGIKEWAKTPYGSYMDAEFVKRRIAELKDQSKKGKTSE